MLEEARRSFFKPAPGVEAFMTRTGAMCLSIHYTADEDKRTEEWRRESSRGWPLHVWLREMEMDDSIVDGAPVFPEFRPAVHAPMEFWSKKIPQCHGDGVFYIAGLDPGFTPGFVLLQVTNKLEVQCLQEVTLKNLSLSRFMPIVLNLLQREYPWAWPLTWWLDPAAANREAVTGASPLMMLRDQYGLNVHLATNDWETRRSAVSMLLSDWVDETTPRFIMCRHTCPVLYDGFMGLYQFKKANPGVDLGWDDRYQEQRPLKNLASHVQDALQYAALGYQRMVLDRIRYSARGEMRGMAPRKFSIPKQV